MQAGGLGEMAAHFFSWLLHSFFLWKLRLLMYDLNDADIMLKWCRSESETFQTIWFLKGQKEWT